MGRPPGRKFAVEGWNVVATIRRDRTSRPVGVCHCSDAEIGLGLAVDPELLAARTTINGWLEWPFVCR